MILLFWDQSDFFRNIFSGKEKQLMLDLLRDFPGKVGYISGI